MHDDGARRQVCPQSHARTGSDPHPFGDDIVHHWWELIHACQGCGVAVVGAQPEACLLKVLHRAWASRGPRNDGQSGANPVKVDRVGFGKAM